MECSGKFMGYHGELSCSPECKAARRKKKEEIQKRKRVAARAVLRAAFKPVPFVCKGCGIKAFTSFDHPNRKVFHSDECFQRFVTKTHGKHPKRARAKGVPYEYFEATRIFERDHWRCQLCGRKTPKRLRGTSHPRAPTLDHITPIGKGGSHTIVNVQTACKECNSDKGSRALGQLHLIAWLPKRA